MAAPWPPAGQAIARPRSIYSARIPDFRIAGAGRAPVGTDSEGKKKKEKSVVKFYTGIEPVT